MRLLDRYEDIVGHQEVERLRFHGDGGFATAQLASARIESVVFKNIKQFKDSRP